MVDIQSNEFEQEKAISIARHLMADRQLEVKSLESCKLFEEEGVFTWVVIFNLFLPDDVACGGDFVIVNIDPTTWRAEFFETL